MHIIILLTRKIKANKIFFQSSKAGNYWTEVDITLKTKCIISVKKQKIVTGLVFRITNEILRDLLRPEHEGNIIEFALQSGRSLWC